MKKINLLFLRKNKYNIGIILGTFILNAVFVSFILITVMEFLKIQNQIADSQVVAQIQTLITTIIMIGVLTIVFFQWLVYNLFKGLDYSRKYIVETLRMIGVKQRSLLLVQLREYFLLQLVTIPLTIPIAYQMCKMIFDKTSLPDVEINIVYIIIAILINIFTSLLSILLLYLKNSKNSSIVHKKSERVKPTKTSFSKIIFVVKIIILTGLLLIIILSQSIEIFVVMCAILILIFYRNILKLLIKVQSNILPNKYQISLIIINRNSKKICTISRTIIMGVVLVFSLKSFVNTGESLAEDSVENNVYFDKIILSENFVNENDYELTISDSKFGIIMYGNKFESNNIAISGIDSEYLNNYENINLKYIAKEELELQLEEKNWNGIILPYMYVTEDDIGTSIDMEIAGESVEFIIEGAYYQNDFSTMFGYTSLDFLRTKLPPEFNSNVMYSKGDSKTYELVFNNDYTLIDKEEIKDNSVKNVLNNLEILELFSMVIIMFSFFMIFSYILLTSQNNNMIIAKMRGLGITVSDTHYIYIVHYLTFITMAVLIGGILAYFLGDLLLKQVFENIYDNNDYIFSWDGLLSIFVVYIIEVSVIHMLYTKTTMKNYANIIKTKSSEY